MGGIKQESHSKKIKNALHGNGTLCWDCRNAVPDERFGCHWSMRKMPVPGWTADKHVQKGYEAWGNPGLHTTYKVVNCPMFIPDKKR